MDKIKTVFYTMDKTRTSHLQGKSAINPHHERNVQRMEKRRATWNFISKIPMYEYDPYGNPTFVGFTKGVTYRKKDEQW